MPVILQCLPDPTDIVVQGEQTVFQSVGVDAPLALVPIVSGEITTARIPETRVPQAMIGQHDWYGVMPRMIGPMAFGQAGLVGMLTIGKMATPVLVDPITAWLDQNMSLDANGAWFDLSADLLGATEATNQLMVFENDLVQPGLNIPRMAIAMSGLAKRVTMPTPGSTLGQHLMDLATESTQRWMVAGVTRDNAGAALGNCRVVVFQTDKMVINPDVFANPIVADTTSDGSGNYSVQVASNEPVEIIAYLPGSPDRAGITVNTVVPDYA